MKLRRVGPSVSSDPPGRPNRRVFRLRVELNDEGSGIYENFVEIADEEVTSDDLENAHPLQEADRNMVMLTLEEAQWVYEKLGEILTVSVTQDISTALEKP